MLLAVDCRCSSFARSSVKWHGFAPFPLSSKSWQWQCALASTTQGKCFRRCCCSGFFRRVDDDAGCCCRPLLLLSGDDDCIAVPNSYDSRITACERRHHTRDTASYERYCIIPYERYCIIRETMRAAPRQKRHRFLGL